MKKALICGVAATLALSGVAQAAVLSVASGDARINRGMGYTLVRGSTDVKPGDLVMLDGATKTKLVYADGCSVNVRAGSVTAVGAKSPCSQMMAADLGASVYKGPPPAPADPGLPFDPTTAVVAAAAFGGGVGVGCLIWCGKKTNTNTIVPFPISP